jgi:hypothetical protein
MEFEIKQIVNFEAGELANTALNVVDDYLSEYEPNYGELDDEQRNLLLKAIFSRAFEILEKED